MRAILDAGPLIAAWNDDDEHHAWAKALFGEYRGPYHTSEAVLTEVAHLTGRDVEIAEGVRKGRFIISDGIKDVDGIQRCLEQFPHCGLADATVILLSEEFRKLSVLTTDKRHFVTYRRDDGTALPVVLPS